MPRFCQGFPSGQCPFEESYQSCDFDLLAFVSDACTETSGAMRSCKDDSARAWSYAITTYLQDINVGWGY